AAVGQADIVCCATTSRSPVFSASAIRPGAHINAVGAFTPEMQEIPSEIVVKAVVVVDQVEACLSEAGDLIKPLKSGLIDKSHFSRELGQIVAGEVTGRTDDKQITFFKSVGNAVQDVVVARRAFDRATEMGIGTQLDLSA